MQVSFAHTWEEDETELRLRVPLGTAPRAALDVYVSDVLVKVYAPGRLLLLDLLRPVEDGAARVQVAQEDVRITLRKREPGLWGELTLKADKAALLQRRQASIDAKAARDAAARAKSAEAKVALRAQQEAAEWEAERVRRDTVAARKAAELEAERGAVAAWQRSGAGDAPAPAAAADSSDSEGEVQAAPVARRPPPVQPPPPRGPLPPLRATTRVEVTLTELQKPNLPARAPLAEQIKLRQRSVDDGGANAPVVAALRADARDVTERHPAFLADTAAAKLRSGHAAAALDAYDRALALADAPGAAVTPHARGEMHEGRAAARMQSGDVAGALEDLRAAAALQPESAEAARALAEAEAEAAMTPDELRRAADARASGGDAAGAIAAYGRMLLRADATAAERVAALANRSACRLGAGDAAGSAADVQAALAALLGGDAAAEAAAAEAQRLAGSGDAGAGAEAGGADELKRRATLARLLARRASARGQLGLYGAAAADAAAAAALRRAAGEAAAADALDGDAAALEALHLGTRASPADL